MPSARSLAAPSATAALVVGLGLAQALAAPAASASGGTFVGWTNAARAAAHLPAYGTSADLSAVAAAWARHLATTGVLAHNPGLTTQVHGWRYVGENVGVGPVEGDVQAAFMASPTHRENILDHDYTQVGIATVVAGGRVWVVEDFRQPTRPSAPAPVLPRPGPPVAPRTTAPAQSTPARRAPTAPRPSPTRTTTTAPTAGRVSAPAPAPPATTRTTSAATTSAATTSAATTGSAARQLLRRRLAAAMARSAASPATTPVGRALRFATVMAALRG